MPFWHMWFSVLLVCNWMCVPPLQKCVDKGKEINLTAAVSKDTITRGLRYAVATGNWGQQGTADLRAGVSQVLHNLTILAASQKWLRASGCTEPALRLIASCTSSPTRRSEPNTRQKY